MRTKTWVELPSSKYDIEYVLESKMIAFLQNGLPRYPKKAIKRYLRKTTRRVWKRKSKISPFEHKVMELDRVTRRDGYGDGTAVMYIREIFEPGDVEYDYISDYVCATQLSQEQVDRLRVIILPPRREQFLLSYLNYYKNVNRKERIIDESANVLQHFEDFHQQYLKLAVKEGGEKFDRLFSFTFAIKNYCGWIPTSECAKEMTTIIPTLAKHWQNLFGKYTPAELGLDLEFSYPAVLAFVDKFKIMCEYGFLQSSFHTKKTMILE